MAINLNVTGNTQPLEAAVQSAVNRIRKTPIKMSIDDKGVTQPLGNMKRGADEFSKSMEAANARIIAFGASMAIINGVADSFKVMVKNMVEVEKSLADINVVMGLSSQGLEKFGDGLFKVAKETGAAFKVAADAATEYARQGLSVEESLKRTQGALILTRLTGMDSAEAVKALTAAMNTYGDQIKDTTQLVSKFSAVDVKFAVSAEDFAAAISRTGQSAKTAGVSIDELVGIVTSAQQQTARGGAVIGNALKTIFTKTSRPETLNLLENLGVAVRDLEGNTIGAKRILTELANTFDTLSHAQKSQITQTMGGLFHINILKAVLSDAAKQNGILAEATQISSNATDEAITKNEELRNTMSAVAHETGMALKQVSAQIGDIMLAPGMEKVLNVVKSIAEGASDLLGTGEGAGNTFAQGFLKGVGNIITGPGLVVMVAVFSKLLVKGALYAKDSLRSLIGVTSEAQKQKAIQTSLVTLFSQNATLGKEMLRTDISRTQKEATILSLLKAQVQEANALNLISKQAASTLYRQGFGANLSPRKGRASGHIPNFANPERAQAAQGGYAAGSIRSMNMPGEGSVIYNSAETVKNFAGFKQPAIMPPHSSKAGKNYQQAFGSIHGFDPYAAGGYIPNYARVKDVPNTYMDVRAFKAFAGIRTGTSSSNTKATAAYDTLRQYAETNKLQNLSPAALVKSYKGSQTSKNPKRSLAAMLVPPEGYSGKPFASYSDLTWPVYALRPDAQTDPSLSKMVEDNFKSTGSKYASKISKVLERGPVSESKIWKTMQSDTAGGAKGAWKAAVGALFEAAVNSALDYRSKGRGKDEGDFDVRGGDIGILSTAFDGFPGGMTLADYKSDDRSPGNKASFRKKVLKQLKFNKSQQQNKLKPGNYASGFIPNFANPLSDAIGREREAGVPVSQIRVGSHNALMSKGNPLGLGVTNTHDEPNGLRDVFGASGFVPNYAQDYFQVSDLSANPNTPSTNLSKNARLMNDSVARYSKALKAGKITQERMNEKIKSLGQKYNANESAVQRVTQANRTLRTKLTQSVKGAGSNMGGMASNMGGMGLMMGLPMLAGFIPGADKVGSGGNMLSSALTGASTGAGIGMMFPGFGTAIGAAVGALGGLISATQKAGAALNEEAQSRKRNNAQRLLGTVGDKLSKSIFEDLTPQERAQRVKSFNSLKFAPEYKDVNSIATTGSTIGAGVDSITNAPLVGVDFFNKIFVDPFLNFFGRDSMVKAPKTNFSKAMQHYEVDKGELDAAKQSNEARELYKKRIFPKVRDSIISGFQDLGPAMIDVAPIVKDPKSKKQHLSENETVKIQADQYLSQLMNAGILDDMDQLKMIAPNLVKSWNNQTGAVTQQNEAIILRLNKEKILLSAQDEFAKSMNSSAYFNQMLAGEYKNTIETMSAYMSKEQIASLKLSEAKRLAAEEYKKSMSKAEFDSEKKLINVLGGTRYKTAFSKELSDQGLSEKEFSGLSLKEQKEIAREVARQANSTEEMNDYLRNSNLELSIQEEKYRSIRDLAELTAQQEKERSDELLRQKTGPQAFQYGFAGEQKKMRESADELDHQLGGIVATNFRDGLVSGMRAAINQAENLGDVLQGVAMNFLQAIQNAYLTAAANQIVGAIPMPGINKSRGGSIRNYSRGGGVPAMVSNGEYVMGRDAVAKYGGAFMHGLNSGGTIPGFNNGGAPGSALAANFGGGRGFTSGRSYQSRAMSGFFYSQSGNVGLEADEQSLMGVLAEEESARQAAAAKKAKKKAFWKQLLGTALSAGISYGVGKLNLGKSAPGAVPAGLEGNVPIGAHYVGGPIRKYASGGHISGKTGIDQIPAMLSEGEYVIRASSARQIGRPMLDRINAGKFNDGGSVSPLNSTAESGISGGNTNNINISINMESGKVKSNTSDSSSSGQNPVDRSNSQQDSNELAEKIKQQVVSVIVEEQRPGGLLSD